MDKLNIALISGGISSEREVSLSGGDQVFEALDKEKYIIKRYDPKTDLIDLVKDAATIDLALIMLHGPYGEDGTIQGMLDLLKIPYQGSGVLGSALAIDKLASKKMYEQNRLPVPPYISIKKGETIDSGQVARKLGLPLFVKPATGGSSIGMSRVDTEDCLEEAIDKAFQYDNTILVESFIKGLELTCAVIGNNDIEPLPVVEIIPPDKGAGSFFDYQAKYTPGATQEICPARIDPEIAKRAQEISVNAHKALCLKGYSRSDLILNGNDIYILETNTIPGMTRTSLLPLAAKTAGISFSQLLDRLIDLALE